MQNSIIYASDAYTSLFPQNSRFRFETFTNPMDLSYIASGDIEVTIQTITFDNLDFAGQTLALRTNLIPDSICSYGWDKIACIFTIPDDGNTQFTFQSPIFFPTTQALLSTAVFEIVNVNIAPNINTNFISEPPSMKQVTPNATKIHVLVRNREERMKEPFQVILDSSCSTSKKLFPSNTNTNFTVQLPQRMEFQKDWVVCLKSIHMSNEFKRGCTIKAIVTSGENVSELKIDLEESISTIQGLLDAINEKIGDIVHFTIEEGGLVTIKFGDKCEENFTIRLEMSRNLMHILGFQEHTIILKSEKRMVTSTYIANIDVVQPESFFVCCNIVEHSAACGQMQQVLQFFRTPNKVGKTIYYEFPSNLLVKLDRKQFDRIQIQIRDGNGRILECTEGNVGTRLQLSFVNVNKKHT